MTLFNLLTKLDHCKVYKAMLGVGAIPFGINTAFDIYRSYQEEVKTEKRLKQAAFNVSVKHRCSVPTVYLSLKVMKTEIDVQQEIDLSIVFT